MELQLTTQVVEVGLYIMILYLILVALVVKVVEVLEVMEVHQVLTVQTIKVEVEVELNGLQVLEEMVMLLLAALELSYLDTQQLI
tara:strand:+ start:565 stop:819 length:255 start_codon:yes stop_codon:yes gene_type:complete